MDTCYCSRPMGIETSFGGGEKQGDRSLKAATHRSLSHLHSIRLHDGVFKHRDNYNFVGFDVLTASRMKMSVFCVVVPCSLAHVYRPLRGACCIHLQGEGKKWKAACISERSVKGYQVSRCYSTQDRHFQLRF
jgi:hypothetical protein